MPANLERSTEQRDEALAWANEVRLYRANVKRDLKAGRRTFYEVFTSGEERLDSMRVFDLVRAVPGIGQTKAMKLLGLERISVTKTVGGLSPRQRGALADMFRGGTPSYSTPVPSRWRVAA